MSPIDMPFKWVILPNLLCQTTVVLTWIVFALSGGRDCRPRTALVVKQLQGFDSKKPKLQATLFRV